MDRIDVLVFLTFCSVAGACAAFAYVYLPLGAPVMTVGWLAVGAMSGNFARLVYRKAAA